jgi:hypothetical protein
VIFSSERVFDSELVATPDGALRGKIEVVVVLAVRRLRIEGRFPVEDVQDMRIDLKLLRDIEVPERINIGE